MIDLTQEVLLAEELMELPMEIDGVLYESTHFNDDQIPLNEESVLEAQKENRKQQTMEPVENEVLQQEESQEICSSLLMNIINAVYQEIEKKKLESCRIVVHSSIIVKDAWKEHLHWPKIEEKGIKRRKSVTPMPFAITSKKWKEYSDDIEARKKDKEDLKMKRKQDREQKCKEKKKELKTKTARGKPNSAKTKTAKDYSLTSKERESEEKINSIRMETSKLSEIEKPMQECGPVKGLEKRPITVGSYVVVKYKKQFFPGVVQRIEDDEYEVRAMAKTGSNYFKWPNPPDQIWYKKTDVQEAIDAPKLIKADCYECPEICTYAQ